MKAYEKLLLENKAWAAEQLLDDPDFFNRLAQVQSPEYLWIGCSDSRVPSNMITGTVPGEIFVHRNIANLVVPDDVNVLSVLHYAVTYLKVKHVIVCGHYGCGGVKAAAEEESYGILDKWLGNIKTVLRKNQKELDAIRLPEERLNRLAEMNVAQQVQNIANTTIIQDAWRSGHRPELHGWIYGIKDGLLKQLVHVMPTVKEPEYTLL
jgi:carbonic anhydrase